MFGDKAMELIKSLSRDSNDPMPAYNQQLVDELIEEMNDLNQKIQEFIQSRSKATEDRNSEEYHKEVLMTQIRFSALLWNKRCLLSYQIEKLKRLRWELGSVLPKDISSNLSESEIQWFLLYSNNLSDYMNKLNEGKGLDLTLHKKPPKRLYIQVRCNTEYGDLELEDGTTVLLSKDSMVRLLKSIFINSDITVGQHYLPLSQCEKLILGGVLEQINQ